MKLKSNNIQPGYAKGCNAAMARANKLLPPRKHEPGSNIVLVIDGMNIAYMAFHAYSRLSHHGKSTSILFGFPSIIKSILQLYPSDRVIVCWDGCKHPIRMETVPGYKGHREEKRDPKQRKLFLKEIVKVRQLLHRMGIAQAHNPNIEGDDMIYWVVKRMQVLSRVVIVSADKDFKQLINWDVSLYNPRTKYIENVFAFTAGNHSMEVPQYVDYLILVGDKSDDIPGFVGIGPQRASAFLGKFWSIENYLNSSQDYPGLVDKDKLRKIYNHNKIMIDLKYFNEKYNRKVNIIYFRDSQNPKFNEAKYTKICQNFGLTTMLTERFKETFKTLSNA